MKNNKEGKSKPKPLLKDRSQKEQTHYTNILLEEMRSQINGVIDYMKMGFKRVYNDMESMEERLSLKIDANTFAVQDLQKRMINVEQDIGVLKSEVKFINNKIDLIWAKEKEQDQAIEALRKVG